jgi:diguanylate cyclase (GGDEF)-like protein/PAS domain S-box-containing protein
MLELRCAPDDADGLRREIARRDKIIGALMRQVEHSLNAADTDFALLQNTFMLEEQVRLRTSELKRADEALRRSHAELEERVAQRTAELSQQLHFLQQLIEAIPGPVFYKDAAGHYLGCNSAFAALIGLPPDELIGKTAVDISPPELAEQYLAADAALLAHPGGQIYEGQVRDAGGALREVMFHKATFTERGGKVGGVVGLMLDISERKRMEGKLRQAATVFDSCAEGVLMTNPDGAIIAVNRAFTDITGYGEDEVIGCNPSLLRSGRHQPGFYKAMWHCLEREGRWQGELWNRRKSGEAHPVWISITAVHDQQNQLSNYVATFTDITERKQHEEKIELLAFSDPLTNLPNRRLLLDRLQQALAGSARGQSHGALFFIDLDDFKDVNDTLGHDKGDLLLQQVALRLADCVRQGDTVARPGGDEFVVMLKGLSGQDAAAVRQAEQAGAHLLSTLNQPYVLDGNLLRSTASIGVTLFNGEHDCVEDLLKQADLAMYQAKGAGRNTLRFFDPAMQTAVAARVALETSLREGLAQDQFELHYQPQVDQVGRIIGAEALVRWRHPLRGLVSPNEFIPLAEETGLILPLGLWVLETACTQLSAWGRHVDTSHLSLAVNISVRQFRQPDFVALVHAALARSGADPRRLKLELTESLLVNDVEDIIAKMLQLKACGLGFSLDDFGTGYSSLSYLKRLPLDQLKIDQCFIRGILSDPNDDAIARMIIVLADSLGLAVIAEGVELEAQRDLLANRGCHAYQGYLFSRPLPLEQFELLLRQRGQRPRLL